MCISIKPLACPKVLLSPDCNILPQVLMTWDTLIFLDASLSDIKFQISCTSSWSKFIMSSQHCTLQRKVKRTCNLFVMPWVKLWVLLLVGKTKNHFSWEENKHLLEDIQSTRYRDWLHKLLCCLEFTQSIKSCFNVPKQKQKLYCCLGIPDFTIINTNEKENWISPLIGYQQHFIAKMKTALANYVFPAEIPKIFWKVMFHTSLKNPEFNFN